MTIEKAIEILDLNLKATRERMPADTGDAVALGIEALKAVKDARANSYWTPIPLLPGETEE